MGDHVAALLLLLDKGRLGESYCIGSHQEQRNIDVVRKVCSILDALVPIDHSYADLITFVADRPGHDVRYATNSSKIQKEIGWKPQMNFDDGLRKTVEFYIHNREKFDKVSHARTRIGLTR